MNACCVLCDQRCGFCCCCCCCTLYEQFVTSAASMGGRDGTTVARCAAEIAQKKSSNK